MAGGRKRRGGNDLGLLVGLLFAVLHYTAGLSITVNELECVYENVEYEGDTVSGNFVVVDHDIFWSSDHPGIDLMVVMPLEDKEFYRMVMRRNVAPRSGMYKFCFHNSYSAPETISFYIHVGHIPSEHDLAKDEHLDPVNVRIAELREALESVSAEQRYLRARDARHRHTNESTRRRLIGYTLAEYLALIFASGVQVFLIRRLFSKNILYNRVIPFLSRLVRGEEIQVYPLTKLLQYPMRHRNPLRLVMFMGVIQSIIS